jgi:hypothetical protein
LVFCIRTAWIEATTPTTGLREWAIFSCLINKNAGCWCKTF